MVLWLIVVPGGSAVDGTHTKLLAHIPNKKELHLLPLSLPMPPPRWGLMSRLFTLLKVRCGLSILALWFFESRGSVGRYLVGPWGEVLVGQGEEVVGSGLEVVA